MIRKTLFTIIAVFLVNHISAQGLADYKFGEGIQVTGKDSSFHINFSTRFQNRYSGTLELNDARDYSDKFFVRRARIKFKGFAFSEKLKYKIEHDVLNGETYDAVLKWNFAGNFELWFGQTKLPGNRERVVSSQKLQFVDRSLLNSEFNIDRDVGFQLHHNFKLGGMVFREVLALSQGEGKNISSSSPGRDYTGRLEWLPFGNFTGKGDYFGADLKREEKPKLSFGFTYDYNDRALRSKGQRGEFLGAERTLESYFADMMFKYRGFSVMAEYADRKTEGSPVVTNEDGFVTGLYNTGTGYNAQAGYLLKSNWEFSGRYTYIDHNISIVPDITQYTFGISKYIVGHNLKVQTDISYTQEEGANDKVRFRFQTELAF